MHIKQKDEGIKACKLFIKETPDDSRNNGINFILSQLKQKDSEEGGVADCCTSWDWRKDLGGFLIHLLPEKAVVGTKNILQAINIIPDELTAEVSNFKFEITPD